MIDKKYLKNIKHGGMRSFLTRAVELGVRVEELLPNPRLIRLTYKGQSFFSVGSDMPISRRAERVMTVNKVVTKTVLAATQIKTPRGFTASSFPEARAQLKKCHFSYPLITKPLNGSLARGVTWNIRSLSELRAGVEHIEKITPTHLRPDTFLVEEMVPGDEFRVLVFQDRVLSCVQKIPASVIGDGKSSIHNLIKKFNRTRRHGFEIKVDRVVKKTLRTNNLRLSSVLGRGVVLQLRNNLNLSDGGRAIERTHEMSKRLQDICVRAVHSLGLIYGGIDLKTNSINSSKSPYWILEINSLPYFNMHEKPLVEGDGLDVAGFLLQELFPSLKIKQGSKK